jgi:hypothetical protein
MVLPIIKNMLSDIIIPFQRNELGAFPLSSKKEVSPKANAPGETTSSKQDGSSSYLIR